jgi:4-hydroxybenzoate polyprenyltransferase
MSSAQSALHQPRIGLSTRLAGWLTLARISNSPTVASDVLAGAALAGAVSPGGSLGLLIVAMVAFYTAGMLLNDLCDYAWDTEHRPDRPLVVGVVSRPAVTTATVGLFALGSILLWLVGQRAFLAGLVLIVVIVAYDMWHKSNPVSPLIMAACRVMVYVVAFVAFAWPATVSLALAGAALLVYLIGLTAIAKSEAQPTLIGYWPAALCVLPALYFVTRFDTPAPFFAVLSAAWIAITLRLVYRRTERRIGTAIARLIAGISLVDAMVMAASNAGPVLLGLAVLAFGLTLLLQRHVEGT